MLLIYLHGFNSSGDGDTARKLKKIYEEYFVAPDYDYINPDSASATIDKVLRECFQKKVEPILIGTSLGGFWANHFAEKYDIKCVLVNPSLSPSTSLKKYMGENTNFSTGEKKLLTEGNLSGYEKYEVPTHTKAMKLVLLGGKDIVIDHKKTANLLKEYKTVIDKNMGHRVEDVSKLTSLIDEAIQSYTEEIINESDLLMERAINLRSQDISGKQTYADEVWELLHQSYEKIGGLVGNGFGSKEEMIDKIPFWKLIKRNGKIVALSLYKDKNGRKSVASATDGTTEGKTGLAMIKKEDVLQKRSYSEISGPLLAFTKKQLGDEFMKEIIPFNEVSKIIDDQIHPISENDPELIKHPELKNYLYQRLIGGHWKTKLMIGTPGNPLE